MLDVNIFHCAHFKYSLKPGFCSVFTRNKESTECQEKPPCVIEAADEPETEEQTTLKENIYDLIKNIKDPEKPSTLEDLLVVYEEGVTIVKNKSKSNSQFVVIEFNPTVPHCSLATLIGLCIRVKLQRCLPQQIKLDIYIKKGAHETEEEINKQINDKERIAAAMENPNLRELVEGCIIEEE